MSTEHHHIIVSDVPVEIVRKDIKNIHLAVYPPNGRVRVAVPQHIDNEAARRVVVSRLPWVHRKRASVLEQARESEREMISGESHYLGGRRYLLDVVEGESKDSPLIRAINNKTIRLTVPAKTSQTRRQQILNAWYRDHLRERIPPLIAHWEPKLGVEVADWRIKRMKTRWGSCSIETRRIWINLELAKKSDNCLEYIVVHEMVHLLERHHNDHFRSLMDRHMPHWRLHRDELNRSPLGYADWTY